MKLKLGFMFALLIAIECYATKKQLVSKGDLQKANIFFLCKIKNIKDKELETYSRLRKKIFQPDRYGYSKNVYYSTRQSRIASIKNEIRAIQYEIEEELL